MDIDKANKITNLINHAFNIIECDKEGYKFKELKEMIFNARNLSTWMMRYKSYGNWTVRSREEFLECMKVMLAPIEEEDDDY